MIGAMVTCIEDFASSTEVDDLDPSLVLTSDCLELINGLQDTPEFSNSSDVIEGDMKVSNSDQAELIQALSEQGARWTINKWANPGRIPYCFSQYTSSSVRKAIQDAVAHYKDMVPCIRFVQVSVASESGQFCSDKPGIFIRSRYEGCWAHVGFQDPTRFPTTLNLQTNWCDTIGLAVHELGHSLGMLHEQVRADSYKYVKIFWQNIQSSYRQYYKMDKNLTQACLMIICPSCITPTLILDSPNMEEAE